MGCQLAWLFTVSAAALLRSQSAAAGAAMVGFGVTMLVCALPPTIALAMRWAGLNRRRREPDLVESDEGCVVVTEAPVRALNESDGSAYHARTNICPTRKRGPKPLKMRPLRATSAAA